jgi:thiazole synthase ThiGH ThiG subunit
MSDKLDAAAQTMIDNLEKNSGKALAEWVAIVRATGLAKHGEIVKYLKTDSVLLLPNMTGSIYPIMARIISGMARPLNSA